MKTNKLYDSLKSCYIDQNKIDILKLDALLEQLRIATLDDLAKNDKDIKRLKFAKKVLNVKSNKSRPILQKAIIRDGFQMFTDSFHGYMLMNHISGLDTHDEEAEKRYPRLENLFSLENMTQTSFSVLELKKIMVDTFEIKNTKKAVSFKIEGLTVTFNAINLETFINILGYKNNDDITFYYRRGSDLRILRSNFIAREKNGDGYGVILPIIFYNED